MNVADDLNLHFSTVLRPVALSQQQKTTGCETLENGIITHWWCLYKELLNSVYLISFSLVLASVFTERILKLILLSA